MYCHQCPSVRTNYSVTVVHMTLQYSNRRSRDVTTPEVVADLIDKVGLASLEALTSLPLGAEVNGLCVCTHVATTNEACLEQEVMDEDEFDCVWSTKA